MQWNGTDVPDLTGSKFVQGDIRNWNGSAVNNLRSGRVPSDLQTLNGRTVSNPSYGRLPADAQLWKGATPNNLISGRVDAITPNDGDVVEWKGSAPNDLVNSNVPASVSQWSGKDVAPVGDDGYVQTALKLWNGGSPNKLVGGKVDSVADVTNWKGSAPNDLVSGKVDAVADVTNWKGSAPNGLVSGKVDAVSDLLTWKGDTPLDLVDGKVQVDATGIGENVKQWLGETPNGLNNGRVRASNTPIVVNHGYLWFPSNGNPVGVAAGSAIDQWGGNIALASQNQEEWLITAVSWNSADNHGSWRMFQIRTYDGNTTYNTLFQSPRVLTSNTPYYYWGTGSMLPNRGYYQFKYPLAWPTGMQIVARVANDESDNTDGLSLAIEAIRADGMSWVDV